MKRALIALLCLAASAAGAHVGSPDVFFEGTAGPYRLLVAVRTPPMIPGVADVEVRCASDGCASVRVVPLRLTGPGSQAAPAADEASRSPQDPQLFTASLWLMENGSWQVRVHVEGASGPAELSVPVPAAARRTLRLHGALAVLLSVLLCALAVGFVAIAGAATREAMLEPGAVRSGVEHDRRVRRGRIAMAFAACAMALLAALGNHWWNVEAARREGQVVYKSPALGVLREGDKLTLTIGEPGLPGLEDLQGLLPDHGHLMHLIVLREPALDRVFHLHPEEQTAPTFVQFLPPMPPGRYRLFAEIVRSSGFPETMVQELDLPEGVRGSALGGDDAAGTAPAAREPERVSATLHDGGRLVWLRPPGPLTARALTLFRFRAEDLGGAPAGDLQLYLGMTGHALFLKSDLSVFAHVHPDGSVAMPALTLARAGLGQADPHAGHHMPAGKLPAELSFPYGFPSPGEYRIFVQFKRAGVVETASFDATVVL